MDYAMHRSKPARNLAGLAVLALHVGIVLALMYGLTKPHFEKPPAPFDPPTARPLPPTPRPPVTQQNDLPRPRDPIVITPDLPPPPIPSFDTTITPTPVNTATDIRPTGPYVQADPGTGTVLASNSVGVACPNSQAIRSNMRYPAQARRDGLQGDVLARFVVGAHGGIRGMEIVSSSNRAFNSAVMGALQQFQCIGQGQDVMVEVPFSFRLE